MPKTMWVDESDRGNEQVWAILEAIAETSDCQEL